MRKFGWVALIIAAVVGMMWGNQIVTAVRNMVAKVTGGTK